MTVWRVSDHGDKRHREFAIMQDTGGLDGDGGKVASVWAGFGHHFTFEEAEKHARLIAAAPELDAAAGPAITALAFAQEDAQRRGDAVAFAQYTAAKDALIAAQNRVRGRGPKMTDITPRRAAITKA